MAVFSITGVVLDGSGTQSTPTRQDLTMPQGEDVTLKLTVTGTNGSAFNITGYSGSMLLKVAQSNASSPVALSLPMTVTNGAQGTATFTLAAAISKGLSAVSYFYDVFITSGAGIRDEVVPTSLLTLNYAVGA